MASARSKNSYAPNQNSRHVPKTENMVIDPEIENLEPDGNGRFSICFRIERFCDMSDEELETEFGRAGRVVNLHRTQRLVFVRYDSKENLQRCWSMFKTKYDLMIGRSKGKEEVPRRRNKNSYSGSNRQNESENSNDSQERRDRNDSSHKSIADKDRNCSGTNESEENEGSTEIFVSNIELEEEEFKDKMKPYNVKAVKFISQGVKRFAFVTTRSHMDALTIIRELNYTMQSTRKLSVKFNFKERYSVSDNSSSVSDSHSDVSPGAYPKSGKRMLENGGIHRDMPSLEPDCSGIPQLIPESEVYDPEGRYELDCSVLVANFPPQTLESELRRVFKNYKVLDICVLNNGYDNGCTKAMLYMGTIYEAIDAIKNSYNFILNDQPLKVIPPVNNVLLRKILVRMETGLREY